MTESDLKKAGQTSTIKRAGVAAAKRNLLELIELQDRDGSLARPKKDYN
ncbi:MAG TPA: hypothetical protein VEB69_00435 [Acidimicrobiia bacterium]|nr:hypothetical protein [Acidimicrobiia bacterium]